MLRLRGIVRVLARRLLSAAVAGRYAARPALGSRSRRRRGADCSRCPRTGSTAPTRSRRPESAWVPDCGLREANVRPLSSCRSVRADLTCPLPSGLREPCGALKRCESQRPRHVHALVSVHNVIHCSDHEGGAVEIGRRFRPVQLLADIDLRLVHSCVRVCVSMLNSECMPLEYGTTVVTVFAIDS